MIDYRPAQPADLVALKVQPRQTVDRDFVVGSLFLARLGEGFMFTAWDDGEPVGIGGVIQQWPGHGNAVCFLAAHAGRHMTSLTRFSRDLFAIQPYKRLSCTVACDFPAGRRWLRMLGFDLECPRMAAYDPAGRDFALYARVRR